MAKAVCVNGHKRPAGAGEEAGGRQAARKRRKADGGRGPEVSSEAGPGARGRGVVRERPQGWGRRWASLTATASGGYCVGVRESQQKRGFLAVWLGGWVKRAPASNGLGSAPRSVERKR